MDPEGLVDCAKNAERNGIPFLPEWMGRTIEEYMIQYKCGYKYSCHCTGSDACIQYPDDSPEPPKEPPC